MSEGNGIFILPKQKGKKLHVSNTYIIFCCLTKEKDFENRVGEGKNLGMKWSS
jgi:hypothetical protein